VPALRTAVIGVGYMGRFHAQKLASCKGAKLHAVVDADAGRAQDVAREVGCAARTDFRDLLGEIDAAVVAVPTELLRCQRELSAKGERARGSRALGEEADELVVLARRKRLCSGA
jgi:prephenate dehydrogenase